MSTDLTPIAQIQSLLRSCINYFKVYERQAYNLRLDSDAPKAARQARVEGVEKVILCYTDAIET